MRIFKPIVTDQADNPASDAVRAALNRLGQRELHDRVGGQLRPDAAMYTRGVIEMLAQMSRKMGGPVIEISEPGRLGVEIDEPSNRETLKLLPSVVLAN